HDQVGNDAEANSDPIVGPCCGLRGQLCSLDWSTNSNQSRRSREQALRRPLDEPKAITPVTVTHDCPRRLKTPCRTHPSKRGQFSAAVECAVRRCVFERGCETFSADPVAAGR